MNQPTRATGLGRRYLLQTSLGVAGSLAMFRQALAVENHPALGTYPAGVSGNTAFIGITTPLTGPYSADGQDHQLGYELAIELINAGSPIVHKWGLTGNGVLGKTIHYKVADSQTKPNVAVQAQTGFIQNDKAIMITGCVSSATAIALEELAQREKVLNMVGLSGSNDTTGKNCQRYGFRSQPSAYMAAKALAPVLAKHLGKNLKAAYLVPDYTYGHSVYKSMKEFTEAEGWKSVSEQLVPLGTKDFSPTLLNIANSGADVFVNIAFGGDAVISTQQAGHFGILKKMKYVVPNISQFQAKELGADIMAGTYGTQAWWWTEQDTYPLAKYFVAEFDKKFGYKPRWGASEIYLQMVVWADAVERAGTFYPVAVIEALEAGHKLDTIAGEVWYRAGDHQMVRSVPVMVGKARSAMKSPEDYYDVLELVPGEKVLPPLAETGCHMQPLRT